MQEIEFLRITGRDPGLKLFVCTLIAGGFLAATVFAYSSMMRYQNEAQITDLSRQTLRRAEILIDYAVITLGDLASQGLASCDSASILALQKSVYNRGAVKDIQVRNGDGIVQCSAFPYSAHMISSGLDVDGGHKSRNGSITLHEAGNPDSGLLGISWRFSSDLVLVAILNMDSLMFDVFPASLRETGHATMLLSDEVPFARYRSEGAETQIQPVHFDSYSGRYPFTVCLTIGAEALAQWNHDAMPQVAAAGGTLGLLIALLVWGLMSRPVSQLEEMQAGLRNGEFVPFMQPIFAIDSLETIGCEVLARWQRQDGSLLPPDRFIPLAEDSKLIGPMTRSLMRQTFAGLAPLMRARKKFLVSFNVVSDDLVAESFADEICEIVREAGVSRRQVVLELTERQTISDKKQAIATIKKLRDLGFRVALDDTGTGHNGLSHVQELGVDVIKIDKHFTDLAGMHHSATTIIKMLAQLARDLSMTTVAEGIETEEQLRVLRDCGVEKGQGYLVSRPLPMAEFLAFLPEEDQKPVRSAA